MDVITSRVMLTVRMSFDVDREDMIADARSAADAHIASKYPGEKWEYDDFDVTGYNRCAVFYIRPSNDDGLKNVVDQRDVAAQDEAARLQAGRDELNRQESIRAAGPDWNAPERSRPGHPDRLFKGEA